MRRALCILTIGVALGVALNPLTGKPATPGVAKAIRKVWGADSARALKVAWCESHWYVWAKNGEHLGVFQMGSYERRTFGGGYGYWAQIRAAHRYYIAVGGWSPWYASRGCWL
jgi:hypothetical protein